MSARVGVFVHVFESPEGVYVLRISSTDQKIFLPPKRKGIQNLTTERVLRGMFALFVLLAVFWRGISSKWWKQKSFKDSALSQSCKFPRCFPLYRVFRDFFIVFCSLSYFCTWVLIFFHSFCILLSAGLE